jgi:hypothetical protein
MWFGVLYLDEDEADDPALLGGPAAVVCAYAPEGPFTVAASPAAVPTSLRVIRRAAGPGRLLSPCCRACREPIDVPGLDLQEDACASA